MWKQTLSAYFNFTKKERTGIIVLLVLISCFIVLPFLYPFFIKTKPVNAGVFRKEMEALNARVDSASGYTKKEWNDENDPPYRQPSQKRNYSSGFSGELFEFDPNTATASDWKRLGLRDKTIGTIQNYLSKGGHFYKPEDIGRIWGLHPDEVQRLLPYVRIAAKENKQPAWGNEVKVYDRPAYKPALIDINTADTAALIALPGIGSKLAQRIINFREKLGGFYKAEQLGETFGLPDSTFQKIKGRLTAVNAGIRQININTATVEALKAHPYIRYNIANAIVQYRSQHGNFPSVAAIKNIMLITEDIYNKAAPYLTVE